MTIFVPFSQKKYFLGIKLCPMMDDSSTLFSTQTLSTTLVAFEMHCMAATFYLKNYIIYDYDVGMLSNMINLIRFIIT